MKFSETSIPVNYCLDLRSKKMFEWQPEHADKLYAILVQSISKHLSIIKSKNEGKVAVAMKDLKGNLLIAGIVEYHENENKDLPGNWSYVLTFNEEDLADATKIESTTEYPFLTTAAEVSHLLYGLAYSGSNYMHDMLIVAAETLLKYLDENATEDKPIDVELDGYFVASAGVEDGKKILAIVPSESMKLIIKEDSALS